MNEFKKFAKYLANESGKIINNYFRTDVAIETKQDESPVTIADKSAEEKMRELIMKEYPSHGILGEEFGEHNPDAEYQWILDPIDGTKSFISGTPLFGTLIALTKNDKPILGVINHSVLNQFMIGDNEMTQLNGTKVSVRSCSKLSDALLLSSDHLTIGRYQNLEKFEKLMRLVRLYRMWGDCYGYYLLSSGFADIMIDPIMSVWDSMALIPIVRGAGGVITDYQGNDPVKGNSIIAAGKVLHTQVVKLLNE